MREAFARSDQDFLLVEEPRRRPRSEPRAQGRARKPATPHGLASFRMRPGRTIAGATAAALLTGIVLNATMFQSSRHPAPLFGSAREVIIAPRAVDNASAQATTPLAAPVSMPMPTPRPIESTAAAPQSMQQLLQQTTTNSAPASSAPVAPHAAPRSIEAAAASMPRVQPHAVETAPAAKKDQIAALLRPEPAGEATAQPSARVSAVQKALKKAGYVLRPDGIMHPSTRQALELFEREHNLPVTGELSTRTLRELTAQSGVAIP